MPLPTNPINLGASPDNGLGDALRVGGEKINDNFAAHKAVVDALVTLSGEAQGATTLTAPFASATIKAALAGLKTDLDDLIGDALVEDDLGAVNRVATLDATGNVPLSQLGNVPGGGGGTTIVNDPAVQSPEPLYFLEDITAIGQARTVITRDCSITKVYLLLEGAEGVALTTGDLTFSVQKNGTTEILTSGPVSLDGLGMGVHEFPSPVALVAGDTLICTLDGSTAAGDIGVVQDGVRIVATPYFAVTAGSGLPGGGGGGTALGGTSYGLWASRPASPNTGHVHRATDTNILQVWDGTAWVSRLDGYRDLVTPSTVGMTFLGAAGTTISDVPGGVLFEHPAGASLDSPRGYYQAVPDTASVVVGWELDSRALGKRYGVSVLDSTGREFVLYVQNVKDTRVYEYNLGAPVTLKGSGQDVVSDIVFLRIDITPTYLSYFTSPNGRRWNAAGGSNIGPQLVDVVEAGYVIIPTTTTDMHATCIHWEVT